MNLPTLEEMDDVVEGLLELFEEEDSESLVDLIKASFGGDRSAAGRYAAEQRWKGHRKKDRVAAPAGGPPPLDDEIRRVGELLTKVAALPTFLASNVVNPATLDEWETHTGSRFVNVIGKRGKQYQVVSKEVIEAEAAVNSLGAQVLQKIHGDLVASGTVTPLQLDEALMWQSYSDKEDTAKATTTMDRALAGDKDLPKNVLDKAQEVIAAKAAAKEAKGALMKASREYNKHQKEFGWYDNTEERKRLWQLRLDAKRANNYAKADVARVEDELRDLITESEIEPATPKISPEERTRLRDNAVFVQSRIGEELKRFIAERREMPDSLPTRNVSAPQAVFDSKTGRLIDANQRVANIFSEVQQRFPKVVMTDVAKVDGLEIRFGGRGGSYNSGTHTIVSDFDDADTLTHEMVHAISYANNETRAIEQAALQRRIFGKVDQPNAPFSEKLRVGVQRSVGAQKAIGYRLSGSYIEDKFVSGYQGRLYRDSRDRLSFTEATEILSVSTENAYGGGQWFRMNGKLDVDLMNTAVGWLVTVGGGK